MARHQDDALIERSRSDTLQFVEDLYQHLLPVDRHSSDECGSEFIEVPLRQKANCNYLVLLHISSLCSNARRLCYLHELARRSSGLISIELLLLLSRILAAVAGGADPSCRHTVAAVAVVTQELPCCDHLEEIGRAHV